MRGSKASILLGLLYSLTCYADEPTWVRSYPKEDAASYYFIGRSEPQDSESKAYESARNAAINYAIRELFGVKTKLELRAIETVDDSKVYNRSTEVSQEISFKNFKELKSHVRQEQSKTIAYVLYSYDKSEFKKEERRLEAAPDKNAPVTLISIDEFESSNARQAFKVDTEDNDALLLREFKQFKSKSIGLMGVTGSYLTETFNGGGNLFGYGVQIELLFNKLDYAAYAMRLKAEAIKGASSDDTEKEWTANGYSIGLMAPLYLFSTESLADVQSRGLKTFGEIYIAPEVGTIRYDYTNKTNVQTTKSTVSQYYYGLIFGYNYFSLGGYGVDCGVGYRGYQGDFTHSGAVLFFNINKSF